MASPFLIIGGGPTAASAVEGIRAHDTSTPIHMMARENFAPYRRPPLSKDLWFGKAKLDEISIHDDAWYRERGVELLLRHEAVEIDTERREVWDGRGARHAYEKLLIATGSRPRLMNATHANLEGIHYFRSLEDYLAIRERLKQVQHVLVLGGGFISIELAAALRHAGMEVTFVYPHEVPLHRVLPRDLGLFVAEDYRNRGIETVSNDVVMSFESRQGLIEAQTRLGNSITTQLVVAGVGVEPALDLAEAAGLEVGNGIVVDEHCRTSDPHIFAAGDVAEFPYLALGERTRIEHWDHAEHHGRAAGENLAGATAPYEHLPFFWSDFFDMGWEAVGDIDAGLQVDVIWKEPFREGMLFYAREDVVRGVLMWNMWEKMDWARERIREARPSTHAEREAWVKK